jgi:hypothetical protein
MLAVMRAPIWRLLVGVSLTMVLITVAIPFKVNVVLFEMMPAAPWTEQCNLLYALVPKTLR